MSRIIITHDEGISDQEALKAVLEVVTDGRISVGKHGMHYCWLTVWPAANIFVQVRTKRHPDAADSFHVGNNSLLPAPFPPMDELAAFVEDLMSEAPEEIS